MREGTLSVIYAGLLDYQEGLELQRDLEARRIADEIDDTVVVLEHPPVITLGHRGDAAHVLCSPEQLAALGISVHRTSRGGDVTYHGPGQVVVYPIVNLHQARLGQAAFVALLEEVMIDVITSYGLEARRLDHKRGVFVGQDKIGAIGIHVSRGVTTHGLALNVDPDLAHFQLILPCGLRDHGVTSLVRETGLPVDQVEVEDRLLRCLATALRYQLLEPRARSGEVGPGRSSTTRARAPLAEGELKKDQRT